jgi:hypothetical protein
VKPPNLKKNPLKNSAEAVPATSQKESPPKFCGGSSRHISKRIRSKILPRQFPPHLKKNPLQNSVEAVPATSQKESNPKFCGGSSRHILKRNHSKILWRQFPPHLKKSSPTESQKESTPKFCGGSNFGVEMWRELPPQNFVEIMTYFLTQPIDHPNSQKKVPSG